MRRRRPLMRSIAVLILLQTLLHGLQPAFAEVANATTNTPENRMSEWVEVNERNSPTAFHYQMGDQNRVDLYGFPSSHDCLPLTALYW